MLNILEAKILACGAIADLLGTEYFKDHIKESVESYPSEDYEGTDYEYFLGFEGNDESNLWTVYARVLVDRETKECTFLDYRTPEGKRMEHPLKPTSFA